MSIVSTNSSRICCRGYSLSIVSTDSSGSIVGDIHCGVRLICDNNWQVPSRDRHHRHPLLFDRNLDFENLK